TDEGLSLVYTAVGVVRLAAVFAFIIPLVFELPLALALATFAVVAEVPAFALVALEVRFIRGLILEVGLCLFEDGEADVGDGLVRAERSCRRFALLADSRGGGGDGAGGEEEGNGGDGYGLHVCKCKESIWY